MKACGQLCHVAYIIGIISDEKGLNLLPMPSRPKLQMEGLHKVEKLRIPGRV